MLMTSALVGSLSISSQAVCRHSTQPARPPQKANAHRCTRSHCQRKVQDCLVVSGHGSLLRRRSSTRQYHCRARAAHLPEPAGELDHDRAQMPAGTTRASTHAAASTSAAGSCQIESAGTGPTANRWPTERVQAACNASSSGRPGERAWGMPAISYLLQQLENALRQAGTSSNTSASSTAASAWDGWGQTKRLELTGRPPGLVFRELLEALVQRCTPEPPLEPAWATAGPGSPTPDCRTAHAHSSSSGPCFTASSACSDEAQSNGSQGSRPQPSATGRSLPPAENGSSPSTGRASSSASSSRGVEQNTAANQAAQQSAAVGSMAVETGPAAGLASSTSLPPQPKALPVAGKADDVGPPDIGTFWGLLVLGLAYLHHSTTGFAVPALLPLISPDLQLNDSQGALLTVGYTVLYAVALIPVGFLADRADRPRLLAGGLAGWSLLTMASSKVNTFAELLATRVGFAAAQATQNPICFSLIPELFPRHRTTAMAAYNSAIYMGRALSFAAVIIAGQLGVAHGDIGVTMVPLNSLDLSHVSILYTQGEMAAITPIYDYDFRLLHGEITESSWRQLLYWLGPPGLVIAACALFTLDEPRKPSGGMFGDPLSSSRFINPTTRGLNRSPNDTFGLQGGALARAAERQAAARKARDNAEMWKSVKELVGSRAFQMVTLAAAVNDVGSWALVSWHATFYQRVYDLGPDVYAPALAAIIPIGGIIGGVGGGLMGDWLTRIGGRFWLTAGATIVAAPLIAGSLLAPEYQQSFGALLVGFALSEAWRAPAAIMVRDVSPSNLGSTGSAVHLCIRNLLGGAGPLAVAYLSAKFGLQQAMLLVPGMYLLSGCIFLFAERVAVKEAADKKLAESSSAS